MRLHKEGTVSIILSLLVGAILIYLGSLFTEYFIIQLILDLGAVYIVWMVVYFFRKPNRPFEGIEGNVYSPVDGKVVAIEKVHVDEFLNEERIGLLEDMGVIWDMDVNKKHTSIQIDDGLRSLEISPDGQMFATGTTIHQTKNRAGVASLWNINSGKQIHSEWFGDYVASTAFSPLHTSYWAVSSWSGDIKIIDLRKLGQ